MNLGSLLNPPPVFVEIGPDTLRARRGPDGLEVPLERGPGGNLAAPAKEKAIAGLKDFLKARPWQPRPRAWCAISSRGVSLRRLSLPGGTRQEFHERLLLQIEAEFPLSPEELAWGYQSLSPVQSTIGTISKQDLLVAAVKKELVEEYSEILRAAGAEPVFTLASVARWNACGQPERSFAMLDVGNQQSELTFFENAIPTSSRFIFADTKGQPGATAQVEALAQNIKGNLGGAKLFVSGIGLDKDFADRLGYSMGNGCQCKQIEIAPVQGESAAVSGLEKFAASGGEPMLLIRMKPTSTRSASFAEVDWKTWGTRVGLLLLAVLLFPYLEALLLKPHLEKKVAEFKAESARFTVIDRELDFLRDLKLQQPPYIDVLYVFSKSVPQGTRFDSLSLNSQGQVSLRCAFHDGQQVSDFRDKLVASGFFTNVVVEEQVPTPDRQKVNIRLSAQENSAADMQLARARLTIDDANKKTKSPPGGPAGAPVMPPGMGDMPQ